MSIKQVIQEVCEQGSLELFEDYDLSKKTSIGVKSKASFFVKVSTEPKLIQLIKNLNNIEQKYLILGKGSNLILPKIVTDPVIQIAFEMPDQSFWDVRDTYWLPSSMPINVMTGKAIKLGLKGWEYFTGIPATLGGAIWMNAGTSLGEIGDLIKRVKILRRNGSVAIHDIKDGDFSYRTNNFLEDGDLILSAEVTHLGVDKSIPDQIIKYLKKRSSSQPLTKKTCGCTFKNIAVQPDGSTKSCIAGKIIDILGLKGLKHKDLMVSPIHGNFIENHGESTQDDFLEFVEKINSRIESEYGYKFEIEAIIYHNGFTR